METRKYQLQKQIVEALNTNNNELYALLKTQWAHRFGVESLVELDDIDLSLRNEDLIKEEKQKNPSKIPLTNLKDTHRNVKDREPIASGVCGERGAGRLRLVILRRECSPNKGARGPAARPLVRRSPRTPRKAGDGRLTGNTTKPY